MSENTPGSSARVLIRVRDILRHPVRTWSTIASESGGLKETLVPYALLLAAISPFALFWRQAILTLSFSHDPGESRFGSLLLLLFVAPVYAYAASLALPFAVGKLMEWLAPVFGAKKSLALSYRVLVYAATPMYIAGISHLVVQIPAFGSTLEFASMLWALCLLFLGIGRVLEIKGSRQLLYTLTVMILLVVMMLILAAAPSLIFTVMSGNRP